jgi:tetratricopeptide (TPR) repeat protein
MSRLLGNKGRQDLDGSLIKLTVQLNSNNPDALLLAATRDNDYGSAQSAMESAEQGLAIEPTNVGLAVQKARAVHGQGDRQSAYARFEDLLKTERGDIAVNLYFSSILASDREQLPRAENLARAAHYWEQGSLRTVANLSFVYLQNGRYDMAAVESLPMTFTHPDWSETQYLCGAALYMQGKKEAREYLQKALDLGLPPQYRDKAKEFLAKL